MKSAVKNNTPATRSVRRRWLFRGMTLLFGLAAAFAIAECVVRLFDIHVANPPDERVAKIIEQYKTSRTTRMIYDAQTGWSPRPGIVTHGGNYRYDSHGIRTNGLEYAPVPKQGLLRIAIFGDSFTHCDDVPIEHSWGHQLQSELKNTEVINFGVSAYGMDQAYQRWRSLGKQYFPKVVVFGFQGENINRNVNIFRGFYMRNTGIPCSKPRFVLNAKGRLHAINLPTLPLDDVPKTMANMGRWEHAHHEWFFNPQPLQRRWWHRSRFVTFLVDRWTESVARKQDKAESTWSDEGEPALVTLQIVREFRADVESQNGRFYIVHLPKRSDLERLLNDRGLIYEPIWKRVEQEHDTIDPTTSLLAAAQTQGLDQLFASPKHAHYSKAANVIIAKLIAETITRSSQRRK